eukprot:1381690-Rhodomonas_salina.4
MYKRELQDAKEEIEELVFKLEVAGKKRVWSYAFAMRIGSTKVRLWSYAFITARGSSQTCMVLRAPYEMTSSVLRFPH